MRETAVKEWHTITWEGKPDVQIPVTVIAHYRVLDDGFCSVEYDAESIDYVVVGSC